MKKIICRWLCKLVFWRRGEKSVAAPVVKRRVEWRGVAAVAAGTKHLKAAPPVPCQDAALVRAEATSRALAFVADGAGSASLSHFGAQETVLRLSHFAASLEDVHVRMLDSPESPSQEEGENHARRFCIHASETIRNLANEKGKPFKEFRCTLLAAIIGAEWIFWMKVGDGHIVREKAGEDLKIVGPLGKGEYANATRFLEESPDKTAIACGILPAADISGIALMTDGAAERLVSSDGARVAGRIGKFFSDMRDNAFGEDGLQKFLTDESVWKPPGYTGDDKGIALLSARY